MCYTYKGWTQETVLDLCWDDFIDYHKYAVRNRNEELRLNSIAARAAYHADNEHYEKFASSLENDPTEPQEEEPVERVFT